jgi:hypothetical protein
MSYTFWLYFISSPCHILSDFISFCRRVMYFLTLFHFIAVSYTFWLYFILSLCHLLSDFISFHRKFWFIITVKTFRFMIISFASTSVQIRRSPNRCGIRETAVVSGLSSASFNFWLFTFSPWVTPISMNSSIPPRVLTTSIEEQSAK